MKENQVTVGDKVLFNPMILGEVFGFLPLRDLKSVRRVSSSWRDISAPTFRRRSSVKLIGYNGRMARFLQVFATTDSVPFGNYELTWFYDADSEDLLGAFWEKYGASIHNIELYWVNMVGVDFVRDILFNSSPNLKSIGIHFCSFYETFVQRGVGMFHKEIAPLPGNVRVNKSLTTLRYFNGYDTLEHDLPISWEEVFTSYPNLKNLKLHNTFLKMNSVLEGARCLKIKTPNSLQLQKLDISYGDNDTDEDKAQVLDGICSLDLSLKELSIGLGTGVNYQKNLSRLLHQQNNLKKLKFRQSDEGYARVPMTEFPFGIQFNHLRYLKTSDIISDSLGFLQNMPNLSELVLYYPLVGHNVNNIITRTPINFTEMPLQSKLTTLQIGYPISTEDMKKLIFWLPGITKAELYLDDEGFRSMCGGWNKLEELDVAVAAGGKLTSAGIYGLDVKKTDQSSTDNIPEMERNPINITCLTNLRQLILGHFSNPVGLDDICVDEGFMKLPNLNYLLLGATGISDEGWRKLFNWDQLRTLLPYNGERDWEGREAFKKPILQ